MERSSKSFHDRKKKNTKWIRLLCVGFIFFILVSAFYSTFISEDLFTDETDNFAVGDIIARGGDVYKVSVSQHMPFSYYMAALIGLFHPVNQMQYRVGFYLILSLIWTLVFFHFRKRIPLAALVILPILYVSELKLYQFGGTMLSEHWAGIGHAILLLQVICYIREPRLKISDCLMISLAIVLTFGCTFTSAYSLAVTAAGVVLYQIVYVQIKTPKEMRGSERKRILKEDAVLAAVCLFPWAVLVVWYAVSGNLQNFIYSVYQFNIDIYSHYMEGLGTDPGGTFLAMFGNYARFLGDSVSNVMKDGLNLGTGAALLHAAAPLAVGIILCIRNPVLGITYLAATISIAVRGFEHYHALHFICAASLSTALLAGQAVMLAVRNPKKVLYYIPAVLGVAILIPFVMLSVNRAEKTAELLNPQFLNSRNMEVKELTDIITDPDDLLHFTTVEGETIELDRNIDYGSASSSPWTWEGFGEKELEAIKSNKTKVVFYEEGYSMWGYDRDDYAAELLSYLQEHYYDLGASLRVRNEYLNEAIRRMLAAGYDGYLAFEDPIALTGEEITEYRPLSDQALSTTFVPEERLQLELVEFIPEFSQTGSSCDIVVQIVDLETGETLDSGRAVGEYLVPGTMNVVYLQSCILETGHTIAINMTADTADTTKEIPSIAISGGIAEADDGRIAINHPGEESVHLSVSVTEPYEEYEYEDYDWESGWDEGV